MSSEHDVIESQEVRDVAVFAPSLSLTRQAVQTAIEQLHLVREFVRSQLREGIDFGVIPGTEKRSLFKSGAEKFTKLFRLGVRFTAKDKELSLAENFGMFSYTAEVYSLETGKALAQCEGSCNSQEKKYRERTVRGAKEATPVADVLNTLQKMAQKRAFVGAVIMAVGASDFFTQDIDSPDDAAQLGIRPEPKRMTAQVPKVASAVSRDQASSAAACPSCGSSMMKSKFNQGQLYCPACKATVG